MSESPSQEHRLPPVDSLPVELLAHIFTMSVHHCAFDSDDTSEFDMFDSDFPFNPANILTTLAISSVNKHWHQVALLTSSLWTDLCVSTELPDEDDEESCQMINAMKPNARRITTFLARSGNAPIDILINTRDPEWDSTEFQYVFS